METTVLMDSSLEFVSSLTMSYRYAEFERQTDKDELSRVVEAMSDRSSTCHFVIRGRNGAH